MKLFFDTTFLVDLERKREDALALVEAATDKDVELWISTVTVSEVLMGAHLRKDPEPAALRAKLVLGQFVWQDLDGAAAEKTGQLLAYLHAAGKPVGYQDVAIAAGFLTCHADYLVAENRGHFEVLPALGGKVLSAKEARRKVRGA